MNQQGETSTNFKFAALKWPILLLALHIGFTASAEIFGSASPEPDEAFQAYINGDYSDKDLMILEQGADEDYFQEMDKGLTLSENRQALQQKLSNYIPGISKQEAYERVVRGRNNWIVWSGGNDRFWDHFSRVTLGGLDFLKTLSNHPKASAPRSERWKELGLINEPCFEQSTKGRKDRYGLWLDERDSACAPDPFENAAKYPGIPVGSRGKTLSLSLDGEKVEVVHEVGSFYGYASGVIGLRLFPNPDFDQQAADRWDPNRYYNDPGYYNDPKLVKPYRVAMTCAFCHVGPSPVNPPENFSEPGYANLLSNVGAQYFWNDRIFFWNYKNDDRNVIYQLLHTSRPGTTDTSLVSSDQINNPRTMNAVYSLDVRMATAAKFMHKELLGGEERLNLQFSDLDELPKDSILKSFSKKNSQGSPTSFDEVVTPRVLKDGSDSVGALGALNRVYVNIGLYSEEWLKNFVPILGTLGVPGLRITPFRIEYAEKMSSYWNATTSQTPDLAFFFLASATPDLLKDAPGSEAHLMDFDSPVVERGKEIFATHCASCHSSKLPEKAYTYFHDESCVGKDYLKCWNAYWNYVTSDLDYLNEIQKIVKSPDFLEENFLSTELRVPTDLVGSQQCSARATNAIAGNIWDGFSSHSYKDLPSIGMTTSYVPNEDGTAYVPSRSVLPGGGRGFLRPPSLVSIWSTAPFFNNNTLGPFRYEGTLEARMDSFSQSIDWLLNPEKRGKSRSYAEGENLVSYSLNGHTAQGIVDVFSKDSFLFIPEAYIPPFLFNILTTKDQGRVRIGPIPAGVPINLITNMNLEAPKSDLIRAVKGLLLGIKEAKKYSDPEEKARAFMKTASAPLLRVSKCDDFIVNKGHYFGTKFMKLNEGLSAEDQQALTEFLKHF